MYVCTCAGAIGWVMKRTSTHHLAVQILQLFFLMLLLVFATASHLHASDAEEKKVMSSMTAKGVRLRECMYVHMSACVSYFLLDSAV